MFLDFLDTDDPNSKTVLVVDGLNLFIRGYQAIPATDHNGELIGGILGFYRTLKRMVSDYNPYKVIVVFDGKGGSTRRRKMYTDYKSKRISRGSFNRFSDMRGLIDEEDSLKRQLLILGECLDHLPVYVISIDGIEADDCIAYIVRNYFKEDKKIIVSSDKDFYQLINESTSVYSSNKKMLLSGKNVYSEVGYRPLNYLTLRCFTGDRSDNIQGVKSVGPKGLEEFFDLKSSENDYLIEDIILKSEQAITEGSKRKLFQTIIENKETVRRNYKLMQLLDVDISKTLTSNIRSILFNTAPTLDAIKVQNILLTNNIEQSISSFFLWENLNRKHAV